MDDRGAIHFRQGLVMISRSSERKKERAMEKKRRILANHILNTYSGERDRNIDERIIREDLRPYCEEYQSLGRTLHKKKGDGMTSRRFGIILAIAGSLLLLPCNIYLMISFALSLFENDIVNSCLLFIFWVGTLSVMIMLVKNFQNERKRISDKT